jgi:FtsZ-binding cell division protein ZapB
MAMAEDIREDDEFEGNTSVDLDDDQVVDDDDSSDVTRTNVRKASSGDDELETYSESVQRRINQLTAKRKQASEEAQAAYQYAQQMQQENEQMRQQLSRVSAGYNTEAEGRLKAQEEQAKRALAEGMESGDYEKVANAQEAISKIAIAKERVRVQKAKLARDQQAQQARSEAAQRQQQMPQQQQAPQRAPDPKLENWLSKNQWFGQDRLMTRAAQAIHEQLVLEEDYDPTSDDYYKEIDARMRREMPHKFQEKRSNAQTVAPASGNGRSVKSGRKKAVELTPGQVAFAKKMRIPLERYAKEVARLEQTRRD